MNISYNWLKEYVDFDLTAQEVADALTSEGLEVGCVEEVPTVKGGLQGLVVGEVADLRAPSQFRPHARMYGEPRRGGTSTDCVRCAERGSRTEGGGGYVGLQIV